MNVASLAAVVLALAPALAAAAPAAPGDGGAARSAALRALPRGATFSSSGRAFQVVAARAAHRRGAESEGAALARAGASAADVLERKGRFLLVRDRGASAAAVMPAEGGLLPVALDVESGRLGVVMGLVNVKLRPGGDAAALAHAHRLALDSEAPRLGMAFLRVPAGRDVAAAAAALGGDPAVELAEPDVLVHVATPR